MLLFVRLAELGSQTMLQQLLVDNFLHCDLHPGNILASPIHTPLALVGLCIVPEWRGASLSVTMLASCPELCADSSNKLLPSVATVRVGIFLKVALDPPKQPLLFMAARCMQQLAPLGCPAPPKSWMQPRIVLLDTGKSQPHSTHKDRTNYARSAADGVCHDPMLSAVETTGRHGHALDG